VDANELAERVAHGMLEAEGTGPAWGIRIEEASAGYAACRWCCAPTCSTATGPRMGA
jgi:hypothetical protein